MNEKESEIRAAFRQQAEFCRTMKSPLTASVLDTIAEQLSGDTAVGRRLFAWDGDPSSGADNVTLRLSGGLHALARSGKDAALSAAYAGEGDIAQAVARALVDHDAMLESWLDSPPQTNEVGRAAAIMAGLLVAAGRYPLPIDLLELGASAGLVLNLARYSYELGGARVGEPTSPLLLAPEWRGDPPPGAGVTVVTQRGVDLNPVYLSDPAAAERLIAYVWADQPERIARVETAIGLARAFPPAIVPGRAGDWLEKRLAGPSAEGAMRIVYHTIAFQYFPAEEQERVRAAIETAGAEASDTRPLGWLSFEMNPAKTACELRLTLWPSGEELHLANAHPHATWIEWL
ncbi:DUF2332 domain-containing protein [Parasphingopyxis marina]|uniref:DUF2332 domain-containing protein n=1 Tax=Parasphingopyxis marina TaxID=2761622 RepID=A0A842I0I6_9SPHN|nr:DUF2332 family protein [Parasphingopyxis marina]MBC2779006.1 DUF2332 domain-containing protein [Parasphingopyxis marina]